MLTIIKNTPFGFVLKLNYDTPYYAEAAYELYIDEKLWGTYRENIISVFGLKPDTSYQLRIETKTVNYQLEAKTRSADYVIDITHYNASGDGVANATSGINTAIYLAPKGAIVRFPKGTYLVDQILLKSDVSLYLEAGCVIKQNTQRSSLAVLKGFQKDYNYEKATVGASWEGNPLDTYSSVLLGFGVENVEIFGDGVIDGNGLEGDWWQNPKVKKVAYRPKNIFLNKCKNITLMGFTSKNSASWNIHPFYCEQVEIYNLSLQSDKNSPNTDGINPESCQRVIIAGCRFDVGDDCIAIKSGKYFMSQFDYQPCEDIQISNCYMGSGHGGIALGSEISCGVRRMQVSQCFMEGTDRGIRIKTRRGRGSGSLVENVMLSKLYMKEVKHGIAINMFYNCDPDGKSEYVQSREAAPKDKYTPAIRDILIEDVELTGIRGCGIFMYGLPESKIENVRIENSRFSFSEQRVAEVPEMLEDFAMIKDLGIYIWNTDNLSLDNNEYSGSYVSMIGEEGKCEGDK
ncbi:polygalacturonase [Lachnospiraceae bacterium PM6-15]|uniref:glycoside hydrolase family 28 protein n=1 Tax=Ohessyouella blattaphilus TaxID=2949333 RepID=UPI003E29D359